MKSAEGSKRVLNGGTMSSEAVRAMRAQMAREGLAKDRKSAAAE
jgi:hypothetical protein